MATVTTNGSKATTKSPAKSKGTAAAKKKPASKSAPSPKLWTASNRPNTPLAPALADPLAKLGEQLGMQVWVMLHNGDTGAPPIDWEIRRAFLEMRSEMGSERAALVIDSPGGFADDAYRIAQIFRRHAGGFVAVIPRWAKSAATLLTLGADEVILAHDAEMGPLDVQIYDEEREQRGSALDEIQALEQLHQVALKQLNQNLTLMRYITRRRYDVVLPHASKLVSDMMAPMLDKIDTVHYAKQSRLLAVAEEYALRLMVPRLPRADALRVAERLVKRYPEHGFVIDRQEASTMLNLVEHSDDVEDTLRQIQEYVWDHEVNAYGLFKEQA